MPDSSPSPPGPSLTRTLLACALLAALVVAGTFLTLSTARTVRDLDEKRLASEFRRRANVHVDSFGRSLEKTVGSIHAVSGLYDASREVSREEFREFTLPLLTRCEGVSGVSFVAAGTDPFRDPQTHVVSRGPGDGFLGIADSSGAAVRSAFRRARETGGPRTAGPLDLHDGERGAYLLVRPVYRTRSDPTFALAGTPEDISGYVACLVRAGRIYEEVSRAVRDESVVFSLLDDTDPDGIHAICGEVPENVADALEQGVSRDFRFGDRTWRIYGHRGGTAPPPGHQEQLVLAGGFILTGLAAFLLVILGRAYRIARLARRQAGELERANEDLAREVAVREAAERKYRSLFEHAIFGIFRSASDGRLLDVNPAFVKLLGYKSAEEVKRLNLSRDVYVDPCVREQIIGEFAAGSHEQSVDALWRRKDGERIWVRLSGRAVRGPDGRIETFETLTEDVTEKILYEEQVSRARRVEAIGRLAGGIAHDFNNLLTVILAHSRELEEEETLPEEVRRKVREVAVSGERAAELTQQLLAFGRQQVLKPSPIDLNQIVLEGLQLLSRLIREDISVETELASDLGTVRADPARMSQVVMNLALNARDAMPKGGRLSLHTRNVEIRRGESMGEMREAGRYVLLSIRDTGEGMDRETRAQIFEPFFTTKEGDGGTGLGLSTVYGIVKQSGGWIWVSSELAGGSTFDLYFPRCEDAPENLPEKEPEAIVGSRPADAGTILVAEDEAPVRELTSEALRARGYRVLEAADGAEAFEIFETQKDEIDGLVTDMVMPRMGGAELATRVRECRADVGILCMSGYSAQAVECHGAPSEGTSFLQKPFDLDELTRHLEKAIEAVRPAAAPGRSRHE